MSVPVRLRIVLQTATIRYLLLGAVFGCCFPLGATLWQITAAGLPVSLASASLVQQTASLLWVIDTAASRFPSSLTLISPFSIPNSLHRPRRVFPSS